jgi:hypothetical protein
MPAVDGPVALHGSPSAEKLVHPVDSHQPKADTDASAEKPMFGAGDRWAIAKRPAAACTTPKVAFPRTPHMRPEPILLYL